MEQHLISPYSMSEPPTSPRRAFLATALSHWCALHHGLSPAEVEAALSAGGGTEETVRREVRNAARLLGELVAAREIRSFARPIGGGQPSSIPATHWELDDYRARMAASAFDPLRPFDLAARPTDWIFLDLDDFNHVVEASCGLEPPRAASSTTDRAVPPPERPPSPAEAIHLDRLLRLPEVLRLTGMSRSTVYRRIEQGRFPRQKAMEGNLTVWSEADVREWLDDPK